MSFALCFLFLSTPFLADEPDGGTKVHTSKHFRINTDLPDEDAKSLLNDLEKMYGQLVRYFGRGVIKPIPGHVVVRHGNFPDLTPDVRERVANGGGICKGSFIGERRGSRFIPRDGDATFYAAGKKQVALHEAVHAFCYLSFGRAGPVWYAEGMAELGQYWRGTTDEVNADPHVIRYLKLEPPRTLLQVANDADPDPGGWQEYAWRWSLCHFLAHHPEYTRRFHRLGLGYLNGENVSFVQAFGSDADKITFEWRQFIADMEPGYRVDLCAWDWEWGTKLRQGAYRRARIEAKRGWQSAMVQVEEGVTYSLKASGKWRIEKKGASLGPEGLPESDGRGALEGIVMTEDWELSEPFILGDTEDWTAPSSGHLYLRCHEPWSKLNDNFGKLNIGIRRPRDRS
ncbi:hypothetical protein Pan216_44210 [Planctomycetes bacterium Pan216]|uniref:DUF1570 domain-containing protein n=1 Tax=Kolteria novifilia TaxID=2527975 RepID=A0A518B994_9BACT|nr:hypothetical protein Pan216_44210 [Planctomycetes bacterium Pan216]